MSDRVLVAIPQDTVNDESVRILAWKFASGSAVESDVLICEVETSKAVMEIHAPAAGTLVYSASVGDEVPVGSTICEILPPGQTAAAPAPVPAAVRETVASTNGHYDLEPPPDDVGAARFTPLALKVAAEFGIDIAAFPPGTLVRRNDVLRKAGKAPLEETPAPPPAKEAAAVREPVRERTPVKNLPVSGVPIEWTDLPRRKIVEGGILAAGQANAVLSSVTTTCRSPQLRARAEKLGLSSLSFNALILLEVSRLLRKYPVFNAVYDRQRIGQYRQINVGWAIDGGQKLVVPVVPLTDQKGVAEIAAVMQEQLEAYLSDTLAPAAFMGGTFTVTDLSGEGISVFQPLISQGQSAILGVGSERSGSEELFYLTLAFDHQLTEGRTAAKFLGELRERLEAHSTLESDAAAGLTVPAPDPYCVLCQRDSQALGSVRAVLLKSEIPPGFVCSLCVAGWL